MSPEREAAVLARWPPGPGLAGHGAEGPGPSSACLGGRCCALPESPSTVPAALLQSTVCSDDLLSQDRRAEGRGLGLGATGASAAGAASLTSEGKGGQPPSSFRGAPWRAGLGGEGWAPTPAPQGAAPGASSATSEAPGPPPPTGTGPGPGPCGTRTRREGRAEGGRSCFCPTLAPLPCSGRRARPGESAPRRGGRRGGEGPPGLTKPSRAAAGPSRRLEPSLEPPCPPRPGEPSPGAPAPPARHGAGGVGGRRQPTPRGRGRGRTRARGCGPP